MAHDTTGIPAELRLSFDRAPPVETRNALDREINAFHARTVPHDAQRFALLLRDTDNHLAAGLSGVLSWQWLFVEALWVGDAWRRRGIGRALLARAESACGGRRLSLGLAGHVPGARLLPGVRLSAIRRLGRLPDRPGPPLHVQTTMQ